MPVILNSQQRQAVDHDRGPMLVVAGAGTGKTTVLVERVARLIQQGIARPDEILAVTYSRNAAHQITERVRERVGPLLAGGLKTGNFHSYCYQLLVRHDKQFGVLDEADLWVYLRRRLAQKQLPLERFIRAASPAQFLEALLGFFNRCHDELVDVATYERYVDELFAGKHPLPRVSSSDDADTMPRDEVLARCREIANVFRAVEDLLARERLGTFGHMVLQAVELLRTSPAILTEERSRARFLLIDEFQDANFAQIELASLLAGDEQNIFAVGDPDQAIYRFRGASSAAFDEFVRRFPATKAVTLVENRRSTTPILDCAYEIISENPDIVPGAAGTAMSMDRQRLASGREAEAAQLKHPLKPAPVGIVLNSGGESEAGDVAQTILERQTHSKCHCPDQAHIFGWCNFAVLYRSHTHREALVRELSARNIPFVVKGLDAMDNAEVRDALAVLRATQLKADPISVFRVAALPQFHISPHDFREKLATHARDESLASVLRQVRGGEAVLQALESARRQLQTVDMTALEALDLLAAHFGLPLSGPFTILRDFVARWQIKAITETKRLEELIDYLDLYTEHGGKLSPPDDPDSDQDEPVLDAVRLMTVHAAKGLEFEEVFVLRANSGPFPTSYRAPLFEFPQELRRGAAPERDEKALHKQEERRLFYVAMTRARNALAIYAKPGRGKKDPRPDGFLRDIMSAGAANPRLPAARLTSRNARPYAIAEIAASAAPSTVGGWLLLPPLATLQGTGLSASAIGRYQLCPLQFKIERDWKLPAETPAALRFGHAMHTALKAYVDAAMARRPMDQEQLLQCFTEALAELPIEDALQAELYARQGERQLRTFAEVYTADPPSEVLFTEHNFSVEIAGTRVRGRMDRVDSVGDGRVAIVDYKTGSPQDQKDADRSLQLSVYALAAAQLGMTAERLVLYNLETNSPVETSRSPAQLCEATEKVREVAAQIAAGEFEPKTGHHCSWCAYNMVCPATEERFVAIAAVSASAAKTN
jgi:DNA helicase-2/ATP-dependent DNA helicase PcrA